MGPKDGGQMAVAVGHDDPGTEADPFGAQFYFAQEIDGQSGKDGHVLRRVVLPDSAGIVVVGYVQAPMDAVFDGPMLSDSASDFGGICWQA